ncbi:MAG TPA: hypothetical protein VF623_16115, partial [Segetibacter sp.]
MIDYQFIRILVYILLPIQKHSLTFNFIFLTTFHPELLSNSKPEVKKRLKMLAAIKPDFTLV